MECTRVCWAWRSLLGGRPRSIGCMGLSPWLADARRLLAPCLYQSKRWSRPSWVRHLLVVSWLAQAPWGQRSAARAEAGPGSTSTSRLLYHDCRLCWLQRWQRWPWERRRGRRGLWAASRPWPWWRRAMRNELVTPLSTCREWSRWLGGLDLPRLTARLVHAYLLCSYLRLRSQRLRREVARQAYATRAPCPCLHDQLGTLGTVGASASCRSGWYPWGSSSS